MEIIFHFLRAGGSPPKTTQSNERGKEHNEISWPSMRRVGKLSDELGNEPTSWAGMAKRKGLRAEFPTSWD